MPDFYETLVATENSANGQIRIGAEIPNGEAGDAIAPVIMNKYETIQGGTDGNNMAVPSSKTQLIRQIS